MSRAYDYDDAMARAKRAKGRLAIVVRYPAGYSYARRSGEKWEYYIHTYPRNNVVLVKEPEEGMEELR